MAFTIPQALNRIVAHQDLTHGEMIDIMRAMMSGETSQVQTAGLLAALRVKVETTTEIAAAAAVMREFSTKVDVDVPHLVDMCGTGGDGAHTFNISTAAMFVAAAAGANIAKHGGRSVSSTSGSADILEALGANIHLPPAQVAKSIQQSGIGFMFAPNHHPAMKHIAPVRKELGVRTVFNILGPLTNPADAKHQLMGVFHIELVGIIAEVLRKLGSDHVLVVHGHGGLDEIAITGQTSIAELKFGHVEQYHITAQQFGFPNYSVQECDAALRITSVQDSMDKINRVMNNESGPARDIVALNAAGALLASNVSESWQAAVDLALRTIASGAAKKKLSDYVATTQALAASAG
ncbi:anthranilate phosphoribosyltransferase [beta proteobacterium MWH-UniP1]